MNLTKHIPVVEQVRMHEQYRWLGLRLVAAYKPTLDEIARAVSDHDLLHIAGVVSVPELDKPDYHNRFHWGPCR